MFELPDDHPGFSDPAYRRRRAAIAEVGRSHRRGEPIADVEYTPEEDEVWRRVSHELGRKHERYACRAYREGARAVTLPTDRVPQLREVDARVHELTGFHIQPVPGLVPTREFYGALADRTFLSTQYIRHHSVPFYTPEPDIVHEIVGHANMLGNPVFADLYEQAGHASRRAQDDEALAAFSKVFWFTLEFGVVYEHGDLRTYGAGILSSYGELEEFCSVAIRPLEVAAMGSTTYDITAYQPMLYAAESFSHVEDVIGEFFETCDDESIARVSRMGRIGTIERAAALG
jgi:phenylalanine-4-hydroxylase